MAHLLQPRLRRPLFPSSARPWRVFAPRRRRLAKMETRRSRLVSSRLSYSLCLSFSIPPSLSLTLFLSLSSTTSPPPPPPNSVFLEIVGACRNFVPDIFLSARPWRVFAPPRRKWAKMEICRSSLSIYIYENQYLVVGDVGGLYVIVYGWC